MQINFITCIKLRAAAYFPLENGLCLVRFHSIFYLNINSSFNLITARARVCVDCGLKKWLLFVAMRARRGKLARAALKLTRPICKSERLNEPNVDIDKDWRRVLSSSSYST